MVTVTLDEKGRLLIPRALRAALALQPGDTVAVERDGDVLRVARVSDPLGPVAQAVLAEEAAEPGKSIADLAAELGIDLSATAAG